MLLLLGVMAPLAGATPGPPLVTVPDPSPEALEYYRSGNWLWLGWRLQGLAIPLLLLLSGFTVGLRRRTAALSRGRFALGLVLFLAAYLLVDSLLELPLRFYSGYLRQHAYGLSNQTLGKWLRDLVLGTGVSLVIGVVVLGGLYALMRTSRRHWWLLAGALAFPASVFLLFLEPVVVAPLFNDFGPMKNRPLEARILRLAERCGIEGSRVFEVEKSVDTKRVNAYVTGFLGTKRIVLWDTLLLKLDPDEVLFVMGHEMGHYVLGHMVLGLLLGCLGAFLLFGLVRLLGEAVLARRGRGLGIESLADPAGLPLVLLLIGLLSFLAEPLGLFASRHMEHEADQFALELTRSNRAGATAFVKLQASNLANPWPGPLHVLLRSSHPSVGERVDFCNRYRPWETGRPLAFGRLIGSPPPGVRPGQAPAGRGPRDG